MTLEIGKSLDSTLKEVLKKYTSVKERTEIADDIEGVSGSTVVGLVSGYNQLTANNIKGITALVELAIVNAEREKRDVKDALVYLKKISEPLCPVQ